MVAQPPGLKFHFPFAFQAEGFQMIGIAGAAEHKIVPEQNAQFIAQAIENFPVV